MGAKIAEEELWVAGDPIPAGSRAARIARVQAIDRIQLEKSLGRQGVGGLASNHGPKSVARAHRVDSLLGCTDLDEGVVAALCRQATLLEQEAQRSHVPAFRGVDGEHLAAE